MAKIFNCKVHGLGFTRTKLLHKYHFDSVDSTSWMNGGKFCATYIFNGTTMTRKDYKNLKREKRIELDNHNISEWLKFQRYAEKNL